MKAEISAMSRISSEPAERYELVLFSPEQYAPWLLLS